MVCQAEGYCHSRWLPLPPSADLAPAETFPLVSEEELVEFACSFSTPAPGDRVAVAFFFGRREVIIGQSWRQSVPRPARWPRGADGGAHAPAPHLAPPAGGALRHQEGWTTRRVCAPFDLGLSLPPSVPQFPPLSKSAKMWCVLTTDHVRTRGRVSW